MSEIKCFEGTIAFRFHTITQYCWAMDKWLALKQFDKLYPKAIFITVKEVNKHGNRL